MPYSKTQFRRTVQARIPRSEGAIEYKLQNVSAALYEINHPFIDGYKPAKNLQDSLRAEVLRQLDSAPDIENLAFAALRRKPRVSRTDFVWTLAGAPELELDPPSPVLGLHDVSTLSALTLRTAPWDWRASKPSSSANGSCSPLVVVPISRLALSK